MSDMATISDEGVAPVLDRTFDHIATDDDASNADISVVWKCPEAATLMSDLELFDDVEGFESVVAHRKALLLEAAYEHSNEDLAFETHNSDSGAIGYLPFDADGAGVWKSAAAAKLMQELEEAGFEDIETRRKALLLEATYEENDTAVYTERSVKEDHKDKEAKEDKEASSNNMLETSDDSTTDVSVVWMCPEAANLMDDLDSSHIEIHRNALLLEAAYDQTLSDLAERQLKNEKNAKRKLARDLNPPIRKLRNFRRFPKFPAEVRLRIWKLAMNQRGSNEVFLPVFAEPNRLDDHRSQVLFEVDTKWKTKRHVWNAGMFTKNGGRFIVSGLSMACYESRDVFLRALPKSLHSVGGGLIRYNPFNSLIQIRHRNPFDDIDEAAQRDAKNKSWPCDLINFDFGTFYLSPIAMVDFCRVAPQLQNLVCVMEPNNHYYEGGDFQELQDFINGQLERPADQSGVKVSVVTHCMKICNADDHNFHHVSEFTGPNAIQLTLDHVVLPSKKEIAML